MIALYTSALNPLDLCVSMYMYIVYIMHTCSETSISGQLTAVLARLRRRKGERQYLLSRCSEHSFTFHVCRRDPGVNTSSEISGEVDFAESGDEEAEVNEAA